MKQLDKKKKTAIIVAVSVLLVAAIIVSVFFAVKGNNATHSDAEETEYVTIIDENGNAVTMVDENNNPVTKKVDENDNKTTKKNSDNNSGGSDIEKTTEEVTESTTHYTTVPQGQATVLPDIPLDDYALTDSLALYLLQEYYGDKYVVNYDLPNSKDYDNPAYTVFSKKGDGSNIEYTVIVNIYDGTAIQTDKKGKTTDISKEIATE